MINNDDVRKYHNITKKQLNREAEEEQTKVLRRRFLTKPNYARTEEETSLIQAECVMIEKQTNLF